MQDIQTIKKELEKFVEIKLPFNFKNDTIIKYITIKNNKEYFYHGGKFKNFGNQKIFLYNTSRSWAVPINYKDKYGNIYYSTRFFIQNDHDKIQNNNKDIKELESIIQTQQNVIDKLTKKIKELTIINNKLIAN